MHRQLSLLLAFAVLAATASALTAQPDRHPAAPQPVIKNAGEAAPNRSAEGTVIYTELWDFEGAGGSPDKQGWTSFDRLAEPPRWHVDDFAGLPVGAFGPIGGTKSLWCGVRQADECHYDSDGYGNGWLQTFTSEMFVVPGGGTIEMSASWDLINDEFSVDIGTPDFVEVGSYVGTGSGTLTFPFSADTVYVRLRFRSDGSFSDEDGFDDSFGAVIVDNLTVSDASGVVYFEDFEGEAVGVTQTDDDQWHAYNEAGMGNFAELYSGSAVPQDSPAPNASSLWVFHNGSPDTQTAACNPVTAGFPVTPFGPPGADYPEVFENTIQSPAVTLPATSSPNPHVEISFDIFDAPLDNVVAVAPRAEFLIAGCWQESFVSALWYSEGDMWGRAVSQSPIPAGATEVRVTLTCMDLCYAYCGVLGSGACHAVGPLIDNVRLSVLTTNTLVVTSTLDSGFGSLRDCIEQANGMFGPSTITFNIPGTGPHVIAPDSLLPSITQSVVIDGYSQPGSSPNTNGQNEGTNAVITIQLDGSNASTPPPHVSNEDGLRIFDNNCAIRGLSITNWDNDGIEVVGVDSTSIEGCFLGLAPDGTPAGNGAYGVHVTFGANAVAVGGPALECRNVIAANPTGGVRFQSAGFDNTVYGNLIGTDPTGLAEVVGSGSGVVSFFTDGVDIGGADPVTGNFITSESGIGINVRTGLNTTILNNSVGLDVTGQNTLGSPTRGMWITVNSTTDALNLGAVDEDDSTMTPFGLVFASSFGNRVSMNGTSTDGGILLDGVYRAGRSIRFLANETWDNAGQDVRNNNALPQPVLSNVVNGSSPTVTLDITGGPANGDVWVSLYASTSCGDVAGFGHGQHFLYATPLTLDGSGELTHVLGIDPGNYVGAPKLSALVSMEDGILFEGVARFSDCVDYANTVAGSNVGVDLQDVSGSGTAQVSFDNVTSEGFTTLECGDTAPGGFPLGFVVLGNYCDVSTSAVFTDSVTVCLPYDPNALRMPESEVRIYHHDGSAWQDVTVAVDEINDTVYGRVATLSPFAIAEPFAAVGTPTSTATVALEQNVPNPFNPTTSIAYRVPTSGPVTLRVFNVAGELVRTLVDEAVTKGSHRVTWHGRDNRGRQVASGVYFYQLVAGQQVLTRKLVLLK